MLIHRHQEGDFPAGDQHMTTQRDVVPPGGTDQNGPLYAPTNEEQPVKRPGRPKKTN